LPIDAYTWVGSSASPAASVGFSRNCAMTRRSLAVSMTPNWSASSIGCRIAATVTPAPDSMCWRTIWLGSMR
jgi:hypothetical protein